MEMSSETVPETFDSVSEHIAVLDKDGTIQAVNLAWENYCNKNAGLAAAVGVGANYLSTCDKSASLGVADARVVASALRQLISGSRSAFSHEYRCDSPTEKFWYLMKCWSLPWNSETYTIVFHQDISEPRLRQKNLLSQSLTDSLTQLANRRHFEQFFNQQWRRAIRAGTPVSMVLLDIDFFKLFNDRYGHVAGDECLLRIAKTVKEFANRPDDLAVRYGGDELLLLLGGTPIEAATQIAQRMLSAIQELQIPHEASTIGKTVTASLGLASIIPRQELSETLLLSLADQALYTAKKHGRNRVSLNNSQLF